MTGGCCAGCGNSSGWAEKSISMYCAYCIEEEGGINEKSGKASLLMRLSCHEVNPPGALHVELFNIRHNRKNGE